MRRPTKHTGTALILAGVLLGVLAPSLASAHVTLHPDRLAAGSRDVLLTFRCPNERSDASTVKLEVFLPVSTPLLGVLMSPPTGWSARARTVTLANPVVTDDGTVDRAVEKLTWTADGTGIGPGQFLDFPIAVGTMPSAAGVLVFKSLQTYSNGLVVRWIQVANDQVPDPASPAPVLTLTSAPTTTTGSSTVAATSLAAAALVIALLAVLLAAVAVMRRRSG